MTHGASVSHDDLKHVTSSKRPVAAAERARGKKEEGWTKVLVL